MVSDFDPTGILSDDLLARIRDRAAAHDRDNTFPEQDLAELAEVGYLSILVPRELGGAGLSLADASVLQQRLAGAAPASRCWRTDASARPSPPPPSAFGARIAR